MPFEPYKKTDLMVFLDNVQVRVTEPGYYLYAELFKGEHRIGVVPLVSIQTGVIESGASISINFLWIIQLTESAQIPTHFRLLYLPLYAKKEIPSPADRWETEGF